MNDNNGGFFLPKQLSREIEKINNDTHLYYDTEEDRKYYTYIEGSPLVVRKYPKWKFWKNEFLIRVNR